MDAVGSLERERVLLSIERYGSVGTGEGAPERWPLWERWKGRGCCWALGAVGSLERERVLLSVGRCGSVGTGEAASERWTLWERWKGRGCS